MSDLFDMGGYEFYVWGSMACFFIVMGYDFIGLQLKKRNIQRRIHAHNRKAQNIKAQARKTQNRREKR